MSDQLAKYADDLEHRLSSLMVADPFDQTPDRNSLRLAIEVLKLIRSGRREPEAAKLARRTLRILKARRRQARELAREPAAVADEPSRTTVRQPKIINGHILLQPGECDHLHSIFSRCCPVCEGGLAVCRNCEGYEAGLDSPCRNGHPVEEIVPGLVSPEYTSTAARDVSAAHHAVAALTEALHLKEPCSCHELRTCETCRIADRIIGGLNEAAEFLLPVPGDLM